MICEKASEPDFDLPLIDDTAFSCVLRKLPKLPKVSGRGVDNLRPAPFKGLPDEAIPRFTNLLNVMEAACRVPAAVSGAIVAAGV